MVRPEKHTKHVKKNAHKLKPGFRHHLTETALINGTIFMVLAIFTFIFKIYVAMFINRDVASIEAASAVFYIISLISLIFWLFLRNH